MVYCSRPPRVHSSSTPAYMYAQRQRLATPSATPLCWASAPTAAVKTTAGNSPTQDGHFSDAQLCRLHRSPLSGRLRLSCAQVTLLWSDAQPTHTRIPCIATRVGLPRSGRWTRHFHIIPSERTRFGIRDQQRSVCCMHANATACCSLAGHGACSPCQIHTCAPSLHMLLLCRRPLLLSVSQSSQRTAGSSFLAAVVGQLSKTRGCLCSRSLSAVDRKIGLIKCIWSACWHRV